MAGGAGGGGIGARCYQGQVVGGETTQIASHDDHFADRQS
jgi:hypothetical protein